MIDDLVRWFKSQ